MRKLFLAHLAMMMAAIGCEKDLPNPNFALEYSPIELDIQAELKKELYVGYPVEVSLKVAAGNGVDKEYTLKYNLQEGQGRIKGETTIEPPGAISKQTKIRYTPSSPGNHKILFTLADKYKQKSTAVLTLANVKKKDIQVPYFTLRTQLIEASNPSNAYVEELGNTANGDRCFYSTYLPNSNQVDKSNKKVRVILRLKEDFVGDEAVVYELCVPKPVMKDAYRLGKFKIRYKGEEYQLPAIIPLDIKKIREDYGALELDLEFASDIPDGLKQVTESTKVEFIISNNEFEQSIREEFFLINDIANNLPRFKMDPEGAGIYDGASLGSNWYYVWFEIHESEFFPLTQNKRLPLKCIITRDEPEYEGWLEFAMRQTKPNSNTAFRLYLGQECVLEFAEYYLFADSKEGFLIDRKQKLLKFRGNLYFEGGSKPANPVLHVKFFGNDNNGNYFEIKTTLRKEIF